MNKLIKITIAIIFSIIVSSNSIHSTISDKSGLLTVLTGPNIIHIQINDISHVIRGNMLEKQLPAGRYFIKILYQDHSTYTNSVIIKSKRQTTIDAQYFR